MRKHLILLGEIRVDVCKDEGKAVWVMQRCCSEKMACSAEMKQESIALIKVILQYTNVLN